MVEQSAALDAVFSSLSDPTRRDILRRVARKEMTVSQVAKPYRVTFAAISKHLMVLERANLITKRRQGKRQYVSAVAPALRNAANYLERYRSRAIEASGKIGSTCWKPTCSRKRPAVEREVRSGPAERLKYRSEGETVMQKIVPSLWFDKETEEAVKFYVSVFNGSPHKSADSRIVSISRYEAGMEIPEVPGAADMEGKVLTAIFELNGQRFMALDGGPIFKFNEAISLFVECQNQTEVDYFWGKLSAAPESEQCGWLKDKYGLSWQIVPKQLGELMTDPNKKKALAVTNAMLKMKKLVIADLQKAYDEA